METSMEEEEKIQQILISPTGQFTLQELKEFILEDKFETADLVYRQLQLKEDQKILKIYKNVAPLLQNGLDLLEPLIKHPLVDDKIGCFMDEQGEYLHLVTNHNQNEEPTYPECEIIRYLTLTTLALHHIHTKQRLYVGILTQEQIQYNKHNNLVKITMLPNQSQIIKCPEETKIMSVQDHQRADIYQLGKIISNLLDQKHSVQSQISDKVRQMVDSMTNEVPFKRILTQDILMCPVVQSEAQKVILDLQKSSQECSSIISKQLESILREQKIREQLQALLASQTGEEKLSPFQLGKIKNKYLIFELFAYSATSTVDLCKISKGLFKLVITNFKLIKYPIDTSAIRVSQAILDSVVFGLSKQTMGRERGMFRCQPSQSQALHFQEPGKIISFNGSECFGIKIGDEKNLSYISNIKYDGSSAKICHMMFIDKHTFIAQIEQFVQGLKSEEDDRLYYLLAVVDIRQKQTFKYKEKKKLIKLKNSKGVVQFSHTQNPNVKLTWLKDGHVLSIAIENFKILSQSQVTHHQIQDVAICPQNDNGRQSFLLACNSGLVLAKYCHHTFSCRAYAIYQVGQCFDRIFLINSELNLYLVFIQNELKIWDQNLKKYKAYDFRMKIPLQVAKVLETGRNSVVFMGTEKHLFALYLSNLLSDSFSFQILEVYESTKNQVLNTRYILVEAPKDKTSSSLKLYFEIMTDQSEEGQQAQNQKERTTHRIMEITYGSLY